MKTKQIRTEDNIKNLCDNNATDNSRPPLNVLLLCRKVYKVYMDILRTLKPKYKYNTATKRINGLREPFYKYVSSNLQP